MDRVQIKVDLAVQITDHQQLSMLGGISLSSQLYIDFKQRQDEILATFALEPTSQNKRPLYRYPFSCSINLRRLPNEELTNKLSIKLMLDWAFNGKKNIGFREGDIKFGSTGKNAELIYRNLVRKASEQLD